MYEQLVNLISTVGFPIAVSIYLLAGMMKRMDDIIQALNSLKEDIAVVIKHLEEK